MKVGADQVRKAFYCGFRNAEIVTAMASDKKSFLSIDSMGAWSFIDCSVDSLATSDQCFNCELEVENAF
jgi:hypothetical protein